MSLISSPQNPGVKAVIKLRKRRERDRQGLMIVEGYRELLRAVEAGLPLRTLYYSPAHYQGTNERGLVERAQLNGARLLEVSERVFTKMAYRDRPEGLLAVAPIPGDSLQELEAKFDSEQPFVMVVEGIEKPGNLGTILRTADAAGVDAVIVCDEVTDVYNPNVVRASIGTLFTVPLARASSEETISWLRERGIPSFAATPAADKLYAAAPLNPPCALVVGAEQFGLTKLWLEGADAAVRIPMNGYADSLNVAQAATILMFEVVRRRLESAGSIALES